MAVFLQYMSIVSSEPGSELSQQDVANSSAAGPGVLYMATAMVCGVAAAVMRAWEMNAAGTAATAHAYLLIFGWCGTLALAIGFYSAAKCGRGRLWAHAAPAVWLLWTSALVLAVVGSAIGRSAEPIQGLAALLAFIIFIIAAIRSRIWRAWATAGGRIGLWPSLALSASSLLLAVGLIAARSLPAVSTGSIVPPGSVTPRVTLIAAWGFLAPLAWGISSVILPRTIGVKPVRPRLLLAASILDVAGIAAAIAGRTHVAAVLLLHAAIFVPSAVRAFGRRQGPSAFRNAAFVRVAYVWLRVAAMLAVWASVHDRAVVWDSSHHALIVGFVSTLTMTFGEQLVSALAGVSVILDCRLGFTTLALLNLGCAMQIISPILLSHLHRPGLGYLLSVAVFAELVAFALFAAQIGAAIFGRVSRLATQLE